MPACANSGDLGFRKTTSTTKSFLRIERWSGHAAQLHFGPVVGEEGRIACSRAFERDAGQYGETAARLTAERGVTVRRWWQTSTPARWAGSICCTFLVRRPVDTRRLLPWTFSSNLLDPAGFADSSNGAAKLSKKCIIHIMLRGECDRTEMRRVFPYRQEIVNGNSRTGLCLLPAVKARPALGSCSVLFLGS